MVPSTAVSSNTLWSATTSVSGRYGGSWRGTDRARTSSKRPSIRTAHVALPAGIRAVDLPQQPVVVERPLQIELEERAERDYDGERRALRAREVVDPAIDLGAVEEPVEGDHLAVEVVDRSQAEIPVLGELAEADVSLVGPLEESADRRGLEEHVRLPAAMQAGVPHGLDVERPDPALVEAHSAASARAVSDFATSR